ncbi:putative NPL/P60 family secreted protein [Actinacidiphila reveromycinica]|uniref:Putative NPL/P60 family secreted protein n=1 Tax=Actinacidiphila reveromycinica TaxID=659352 RepID=A0A7U3UQF6_9ACTN|nr:C40 family peptidase [Streptomyces sp. SN-593]BBA96820.1 putative NPL/P60 family secreted protein [Streptomyces sp. SN-593]
MASHRRTPKPGPASRTSRVTVLSAAAAAAAALSGGAAQLAAADPSGDSAPDASTRLDQLYQQAEQDTQRYDAAQETAERLRGEVADLQDRAARGQKRVNALRDDLGAVAASQYREGAVDPTLALLLSDRPSQYLDQASALDRLGARQAARLGELQEAERVLRQERDQATGKLAELRSTSAQLRRRKEDVQRALAGAQAVLHSMPAAAQAAYRDGGTRSSRDQALPPLLDLPASSGRAAVALAAARRMLGAPYVWGATGPRAFDCSGLMQYAYAQAGVALPRTSQAQMNAGRHVPLSQARPGDLVIYRSDASHVAMYVGGGQVIHAPYPGARVRYDPVGMMPITAITRP